MSNVELQRFQSNNSSWNGQLVPSENPSYSSYNQPDMLDHTSSDRMYDIVPGEKESRPPLPEPRKTTSNSLYATRGDTIHHPHAASTLDSHVISYSPEGLEADEDSNSSKCLRITCLSILVAISLFLAIVAVILVMLLWFGVYIPPQGSTGPSNCPSVDLQSGIVSATSSPVSCICPSPDISPLRALLQNETSSLNESIIELLSSLASFRENSTAIEQDLFNQASSVSYSIDSVNSTCVSALANISSQNVSIAGLRFDAQLQNAPIYGQCVLEYLSECSIGLSATNCTTEYFNVTVEGYYNMDTSCHIGVTPVIAGSLNVAPVANLRIVPLPNVTVSDDASTRLAMSMMRCECNVLPLAGSNRNNVIRCSLFRSRCPVVSQFNVTIVTP